MGVVSGLRFCRLSRFVLSWFVRGWAGVGVAVLPAQLVRARMGGCRGCGFCRLSRFGGASDGVVDITARDVLGFVRRPVVRRSVRGGCRYRV